MQDRIISLVGLLTIIIITSLGFTQTIEYPIGVTIENVVYGDFVCTDPTLSTQTACEAVGTCSNGTTTLNHTNKTSCEAATGCSDNTITTQSTCNSTGTCSDSQYTTESTCASKGTCSTASITTAGDCGDAGAIWTWNTWTSATWTTTIWTQTYRWVAKGTLDIVMDSQAGCLSCDDPTFDNKKGCEVSGNNNAGGKWSFDTSITDAANCSGTCSNQTQTAAHIAKSGDVSQFQNLDACTLVLQTPAGLCSDSEILTTASCEAAGGTWENNTWTPNTTVNGTYFSGKVGAFQFQLFGAIVGFCYTDADDNNSYDASDPLVLSFNRNKCLCGVDNGTPNPNGNACTGEDDDHSDDLGNYTGNTWDYGWGGGETSSALEWTVQTSVDNYNEVTEVQTPNVLGFMIAGNPVDPGTDKVLTQVSFSNYEQVGLCFAPEIGICDAANSFGDEYGECVTNIAWGDCACHTGLTEDCAGTCGVAGTTGYSVYDCRYGDGTKAANGTDLLYPQADSTSYCTGSTGYVAVEQDCAGVCNGSGVINTAGDNACCASGSIDCTNTCDGQTVMTLCGCGETPPNTTTQCCADGLSKDDEPADCAGVCGGSSSTDCTETYCGVQGDGTFKIKDCADECGGSLALDCAEVCGGPGVNNTNGDEECCATGAIDCANVCDGTSEEIDGVCSDPLSIFQINSYLPDEFAISQNYPNPFNPVTSITFDVAEMDEVSLIVYDLMGKEVATLVSGTYAPGRYQVEWDAVNNMGDGIVSGMYIYRYINSDKAIIRKMLYLK